MRATTDKIIKNNNYLRSDKYLHIGHTCTFLAEVTLVLAVTSMARAGDVAPELELELEAVANRDNPPFTSGVFVLAPLTIKIVN